MYFTPDGQHLLTGSDDHHIFLWDWDKGAILFHLTLAYRPEIWRGWSAVWKFLAGVMSLHVSAGTAAVKWDSGHTNNVFQARQIGFGSTTVVSCAADGQVRARSWMVAPRAVPSLCLPHGLQQ